MLKKSKYSNRVSRTPYLAFLVLILLFSFAYAQEFEKAYDKAHAYKRAGDYENADKWAKTALEFAEKRFGQLDRNYAAISHNLAYLYESMKYYEEAEALYKQAFSIKEIIFGERNHSYATSLNNLANLYRTLGRYDEAEPLYKKCIEIDFDNFSNDPQDYANSVEHLAILYTSMERYKEAEEQVKKALNMYNILSKTSHPSYVDLIKRLGYIYKAALRYEEAEAKFLSALEIRKKQLGPSHPDYAAGLEDLANLYNVMQRPVEAESLFVHITEIYKNEFGETDSKYLDALNELALFYASMRRYEDAEPIYKQCIEINRITVGQKDPAYANSVEQLAQLYVLMDRFGEAEQVAEHALGMRSWTVGDDHPSYASSAMILGRIYELWGRYDEAETMLWRALEIRKAQLGEDHPDYISSVEGMARLYTKMGRYEKAGFFQWLLTEFYKKELGENHPKYLAATNKLHELIKLTKAQPLELRDAREKPKEYYEKGDLPNAIQWAVKVLELEEKEYGKEHINYAISLNNLAGLYRQTGRYEDAERLQKKAFGIFEAHSEEKPVDYAKALNNLADLYLSTGRYEEAEPLYNEALDIKEATLGEDHFSYVTTLNNLAGLYYWMDRHDEAEATHKRALGITERTVGKRHPDYVAIQFNLARFYKSTDRYVEAEALFKEGLEVYRTQVVYKDTPDYASALADLAELYAALGRRKEAESYFRQAVLIFIRASENHPRYATTLSGLGELYVQMGRDAEAEAVLIQALDIHIRVLPLRQNLTDYFNSLEKLAGLFTYTGRYSEADSLYQQVLEFKGKFYGKKSTAYAQSLNNFGFLCLNMGRYSEAQPVLLQAADTDMTELGEVDLGILDNLASLYMSLGRYEDAEPVFRQTNAKRLRKIQKLFAFMSDDEKSEFYSTISVRFDIFKSFVIKRNTENPVVTGEMYNLQLATKGLLLDSINKIKRAILSSGDKELLDSYNWWMKQKEAYAKIYIKTEKEIGKMWDFSQMEQDIKDLERDLLIKAKAFIPSKDTMINWIDVQKQLKVGEAAVEVVRFQYFNKAWTDTVYYVALILTKETLNTPRLVILGTAYDLETKYREEHLESRRNRNENAYRHYWQPIKQELAGIRKVYLSPDGIYNQINLNILSVPGTDDKYLADEIDIHLISNTKDLVDFGRMEPSTNRAALFGLSSGEDIRFPTVGDGGLLSGQVWPDLPGTKDEIQGLGSLLASEGWQTTAYLGPEALEGTLKAVENPAVLHIATHGFFKPSKPKDIRDYHLAKLGITQSATFKTNPMLHSGLVLTPGETNYPPRGNAIDDGILTAYEAANLTLDKTDLVVLSACETGVGEVKNGEGVYGIQRAFQVAGAKTILMSLWKVRDDVTQELMIEFYTEWIVNGKDKRQAFRDAQLRIREEYEEPYLWGGFVMVGE